MKLCPKIILEGTRLTHKTDIAFALNEHPRIVGPRKYRYHSPLVSAEWCGFTNYPWGRGLINFEPQEEELAIETYDFGWLEQGLKELGFRLVFCTRSAESFAQARAERVKVSGKPSQYGDLQVFIHEQEVMERFVKASVLDTLRVDISDDDVNRAVESIAFWLENTGGLYAVDK